VLNISTLGTKNAIVFPLPVLAAPKTSFPARSGGIVRAWTSVMVVKPIFSIAEVVCGDRFSVENGTRSYDSGVFIGGGSESEMGRGGWDNWGSRVTLEDVA
jgi:hypothetical protein